MIKPDTLLNGYIIVHMAKYHPQELLDVGLEMYDVSIAQLSEMLPEAIDLMIQRGQIQLPLLLPNEIIQLIRSIKKK
jgi:hypothetical protein